MSRLLTMPSLAGEPRTLGAPEPSLDAAMSALLEQVAADAYARGVRDGAAQASGAIEASVMQLLAAIARAAGELRQVAADADVQLALEIARAVLDREPADAGQDLLDRILAALAAVDDDGLTVQLNPQDAAAIGAELERLAALHGTPVRVSPEPAMAPGDARVVGRWSRADLGRDAAFAAVQQLCEEPVDA